MQKKPLVIGNWKMHKTLAETKQFFEIFLKSSPKGACGFAVPYTTLPLAASFAKSDLWIGSQNVHHEKQGAFTGEISAKMAHEAGASFTLVGHSERRQYFFETDKIMHQKIIRSHEEKMKVILCVGENLRERENGQTSEVLKRQLDAALEGIDPQDIIFAYEPVWAIGTGKVASPEMIYQAHEDIRSFTAKNALILYGGSVNSSNCSQMITIDGVDGFLVGGASLDPHSFLEIIQASHLAYTSKR